MRIAPALLAATLSLATAALPAFAQATATQTTPTTPSASAPRLVEPARPSGPSGREQLAERIIIEDSGARISELRFGGETRSITVQPKGGMPAYDVRPISGADTQTTSGARTWKIFGF